MKTCADIDKLRKDIKNLLFIRRINPKHIDI